MPHLLTFLMVATRVIGMTNTQRTNTVTKRNGTVEATTWSEDGLTATTIRTLRNGTVITFVNGVRV